MSKNSSFAVLAAGLIGALMLLQTSGCERIDIAEAEKAMHAGNYAEAYCIWRQLADKGHPIAMYNIGWMYHNGFGLLVDDDKAASWWLNAAESGLEDAEQALGMLYYYGGKGVARDLEKSAEYLMPGAVRGDEEAALLLESFIGRLDPEMRKRFQQLMQEQNEDMEDGAAEVAANLGGKPLIVTASRANLRAEASTTATVVATLHRDAALAELERQGDWIKVNYAKNEPAAWIYAELVRPIE